MIAETRPELGAAREPRGHQKHTRDLPLPDDRLATELVPRIRETWQQRQDLLRETKSLENRCRAVLIRYFSVGHEYDGWEPPKEVKAQAAAMLKLHKRKRVPVLEGETLRQYQVTRKLLAPFLAALKPIQDALREREQELEILASELPIASWIEETPGYSLLALAGIVAFSGDLSRFATPWRLEVMMSIGFVNGEKQRRVAGDPEKATAMRFAPTRRALLYALAQGAVMNKSEPWYTIYSERKTREETTRPELAPWQRSESAKRVTARKMLQQVWKEWRRARGLYHWGEER